MCWLVLLACPQYIYVFVNYVKQLFSENKLEGPGLGILRPPAVRGIEEAPVSAEVTGWGGISTRCKGSVVLAAMI